MNFPAQPEDPGFNMVDQEKSDLNLLTSLIYALARNDVSAAKRLIKPGFDIDQTIPSEVVNNTLLMYAIEYDDVDVPFNEGRVATSKTLLLMAAENKQVEMTEMLLKAGAQPDKKIHSGENTFHISALERVIGNADDEKTEQIIRFLVKHGANLNRIKDGFFAFTPLCYAISIKSLSAVELLIDLGAKLQIGESVYDDALHVADGFGTPEIKAILIDAYLKKLAKPLEETHAAELISTSKRVRI